MTSENQLPLPSASPISVQEQVRVVVDFLPATPDAEASGRRGRGPKVRPLTFLWRNKKYTIKKTNLVYKRVHGARFDWAFACSDEANSFVLLYDPVEMTWVLEEVYEGN